jgi:hypothetical protein
MFDRVTRPADAGNAFDGSFPFPSEISVNVFTNLQFWNGSGSVSFGAVPAGENAAPGQQCLHPLGEIRRFEHASRAALPARLIAGGGTEYVDAAFGEQRDIGTGRNVVPHQVIHGWRHRDRRGARQTQRREQIIGLPGGQACQKVRARRRDQHRIRPARELDVAHRRLRGRIPQLAAHAAAGDGLEGGRSDELPCRRGHDHLDFRAALAQTPHKIRTLVGGDAAGHAEKDALALHGMFPFPLRIIAPRCPRRAN